MRMAICGDIEKNHFFEVRAVYTVWARVTNIRHGAKGVAMEVSDGPYITTLQLNHGFRNRPKCYQLVINARET